MLDKIRLQAAGWQVTLIEARGQLGGRAGQIQDAGYTFDMGPTILTLPSVLRRIFVEAGRDIGDVLVGADGRIEDARLPR